MKIKPSSDVLHNMIASVDGYAARISKSKEFLSKVDSYSEFWGEISSHAGAKADGIRRERDNKLTQMTDVELRVNAAEERVWREIAILPDAIRYALKQAEKAHAQALKELNVYREKLRTE